MNIENVLIQLQVICDLMESAEPLSEESKCWIISVATEASELLKERE